MKPVIKLIIAVSVPLLVGFASSLFTITGVESWYKTINLPSWNPPDQVFGPVWTTLYILMGIAFYLVWINEARSAFKRKAIIFFIIQLVLNFLWSVIFFGMEQIGWALVEISVLWLLILFTILSFGKISKTAAWLMVPYICWVSFAALLNYNIWKLNT